MLDFPSVLRICASDPGPAFTGPHSGTVERVLRTTESETVVSQLGSVLKTPRPK